VYLYLDGTLLRYDDLVAAALSPDAPAAAVESTSAASPALRAVESEPHRRAFAAACEARGPDADGAEALAAVLLPSSTDSGLGQAQRLGPRPTTARAW